MPLKIAKKVFAITLLLGMTLAIIAVAALFSSPWWIGSVAADLARQYDVEIGSHETLSFGTIAFNDVRYDDGENLNATVKRIEAPSPPVILLARILGKFAPSIVVSDVNIIESGGTSAKTTLGKVDQPTNLPELAREYNDLGVLASDWFESITVTNLHYQQHGFRIKVPQASLAFWQINLKAILPNLDDPIQIELMLSPEQNAQTRVLDLKIAPNEIVPETIAGITVKPTQLDISGGIIRKKAKILFNAHWNDGGLIPLTAELTSNTITIPEELIDLHDDYEQPVVHFKATWADSKYAVQLVADVEPEADESEDYPTLHAQVDASGDLQSVTIESLEAHGGWLNAQLSNPISITFDNLADVPDAQLTIDANFNQQKLLPLKGTFNADITVKNRGEELPLIHADWNTCGLVYAQYPSAEIDGKSSLDWPLLVFNEIIASTEDGSRIKLDAKANLESQELEAATADGNIGLLLAESLGLTGATYTSLKFNAKASGPFDQLRHSGETSLTDLKIGQDSFNCDLNWTAEALRFSNIDIKGDANAVAFTLNASADLGNAIKTAEIKEALIKVENYADLTLQQPFEIQVTEESELRVSRLSLDGSEGGHFEADCSLDWPRQGKAMISASNVSAIWLGLFLEAPLPFPSDLNQFSLNAEWNEGPMTFDLDAKILGGPSNQVPFQIDLKLLSDGQTIRIENLEASQDDQMLLQGKGTMPIELDPTKPEIIILEPDESMDFQLTAKPGATAIWSWLEGQSGAKVSAPYLDLVLNGSLIAPKGFLKAGFDSISFDDSSDLGQIPDVSQAVVSMTFQPDQIQVEQLGLVIAEHPLEATATLPMSTEQWRNLATSSEVPDLEKLTARLDFQDVPVSAFEELLPTVIRSNGTISLIGEINPGFDWNGKLQIEDVETRPIQPVGALSGIVADLELRNTTLTINTAKASIGGREVAIGGTVGIQNLEKPDYDLTIQGENIPFVRSPGLIMRGTPDLTLTTDDNGSTTLGGTIELNESFYTIDLTAFSQSGGGPSSDPNRRFPYFSVEDEPMSRWRLDVKIIGSDFLRVRTPVFEGKVTADFDLSGRMREPFAFGQASISKGIVMFPFANFRVQNGTVTVTQDDPYQPQLDVTATSRAYGYDLTMRLTGTPDDPQLAFSSTPSLEAGDILLMVTAGQIPDDNSRSSQSRLAGLGVFVGNTILVDLGLVDPLDDRLQVFIAEDISEGGRDTIRVIYRINEIWAVVGQYDRFDAYTLDFKWTIYEE
ncbi:translocation/assembly module TamB domain-containing protein [Rubellicoccus peritrichatus]|uniref:Translocation/assembly module TamB domain-containing protein n=1 Tax=Rubellicoccus peritrichatus TaxID=3080537 RepID=A0AAQ3L9P0_9BACT|nr:translocation/assembly module TamB domain-containing protein [Puniceicoccus sp. CR14]WOO39433.1 translocation/assembly module TamB domain-containing protein [Puniceicoccus sp. CR14]